MKKIIFCTLAIAGILVASCKKGNLTPNSVNSGNLSNTEHAEALRLNVANQIVFAVEDSKSLFTDLKNNREKSSNSIPTFEEFILATQLSVGKEYSDATYGLFKTIYDYHVSGLNSSQIVNDFKFEDLYELAKNMEETQNFEEVIYADNTRVSKAIAPQDSVKKECKVCKATAKAIEETAKWIWANRSEIMVVAWGVAGIYSKVHDK
jgi:hypothetical protein